MTDKTFCNCLAWENDLDPAGYGVPIQRLLALEVALPWQRNALDSLPPALEPVLEQAKTMEGNILSALGVSNLFLIAPEHGKPVTARRRVLVWERPASPFASFHRREYILPEEALTDFGWAISFRPALLPQFDRYLVNAGQPLRDFLVCTHGSRDAACGKYGYPLYDRLKAMTVDDPHMRVWRVSHIGGHIFAPTMVELPAGIFWGNLYGDTVDHVVQRRGDVTRLRLHYRGWSGAARGFAQAAELRVFLHEGWPWLDWPRIVTVTAQDGGEQPQWAEVRIAFEDSNGCPCVYTVRVEVSHYIEAIASTGDTFSRPYAQYVVTQLFRQPVMPITILETDPLSWDIT